MRLNSDEAIVFIKDPLQLALKQQVGVDLTINKIKVIRQYKKNGVFKTYTKIEEQWTYKEIEAYPLNFKEDENLEGWLLPSGIYSLTFDQGIELPNNVSANIIERSSFNRLGNQIKSSIYDPGFKVEKMGATLYLNFPMLIEKHSRVAQIVMEYNKPIKNIYNGQFQNEKDKK